MENWEEYKHYLQLTSTVQPTKCWRKSPNQIRSCFSSKILQVEVAYSNGHPALHSLKGFNTFSACDYGKIHSNRNHNLKLQSNAEGSTKNGRNRTNFMFLRPRGHALKSIRPSLQLVLMIGETVFACSSCVKKHSWPGPYLSCSRWPLEPIWLNIPWKSSRFVTGLVPGITLHGSRCIFHQRES